MTKDLLRAKEAADLLGCGVSTLWRWAANGTIPRPIKIGGISRWKKSELTSVIAAAGNLRSE